MTNSKTGLSILASIVASPQKEAQSYPAEKGNSSPSYQDKTDILKRKQKIDSSSRKRLSIYTSFSQDKDEPSSLLSGFEIIKLEEFNGYYSKQNPDDSLYPENRESYTEKCLNSYPSEAKKYSEPLENDLDLSDQYQDPALNMTKAQFCNFFDDFYNIHQENIKLQHQLKEQIFKVSTLLHTLSSSGQMIEGLVRANFREMQKQCFDRFNTCLKDLDQRILNLEHDPLRAKK